MLLADCGRGADCGHTVQLGTYNVQRFPTLRQLSWEARRDSLPLPRTLSRDAGCADTPGEYPVLPEDPGFSKGVE